MPKKQRARGENRSLDERTLISSSRIGFEYAISLSLDVLMGSSPGVGAGFRQGTCGSFPVDEWECQ